MFAVISPYLANTLEIRMMQIANQLVLSVGALVGSGRHYTVKTIRGRERERRKKHLEQSDVREMVFLRRKTTPGRKQLVSFSCFVFVVVVVVGCCCCCYSFIIGFPDSPIPRFVGPPSRLPSRS